MGVDGQHHVLATLPPRKKPGTHCTVGWVGLWTCLDGCEKSLLPEVNLQAVQAVASHYTNYTTLSHS